MKTKFKKPDRKVKREQPRKDSRTKRVNFDNVREDKFEKDLKKEFSRNDGNDVSWYTKNAGLTMGSTLLPFTTVLGSRPPYGQDATSINAVPGVMALNFYPNFVPDNGYVINQCAQSYYSEVVHANSRNQTYDPADLMIVTLAGAQVFAAIGNAIRAYGVMNTFSAENRYLPDALLQGMGFDWYDLRNNISRMLFDINHLIAQSRQIWIPNTFPIINRWFWMNSSIYTDADSIKPQMYLYRQAMFYKYSGFTDRKGGELVAAIDKSKILDRFTWSNYVGMIQSMLNALINDQDRGIMFGDILKCYGPEKIFVLNEIGLDYKTDITYSQEVLWQVENYVNGVHSNFYIGKLTQNTTGQISQSWVTTQSTPSYNKLPYYRPEIGLLNFHQKEPPTSEQLLVATRMMCLGNIEVATDVETVKALVPSCSGTEIGCTAVVLYYNYGAGMSANGSLREYTSYSMYNEDTPFTDGYSLQTFFAFDWRPSVYTAKIGTTHPSGLPNYFDTKQYSIVCDYENYTYIDVETLRRIHLTAIYSLFNVPLL